jgi:hypothetical protein
MCDVFHRTDGRYLRSVNTPEFDSADWIINPDVSAAAGQPVKYWTPLGTTNPEGFEEVGVVDAAAQTAIDDAIAATNHAASQSGEKTRLDVEKVLKAIVEGVVGEINLLRDEHSLANRTFTQIRTAIRTNIDNM